MTIEDYIWDVFEIKNALEDDSDIEEMWVLHKLNQYRALHIQQEYGLTQFINPVWLQRKYKFSWEKVNAADDPNIEIGSVTLGKAEMPRVVSLPDDQGTYRISGSGSILQFEPITFDLLMMKADVGEQLPGQYGYYSKVADTVYIWPYIMEGSAMLILANPLDVQINDAGTLRSMTFSDNYPLDPGLAQKALLDFLTKDMLFSDQSISDIMNDSQRQLKILKDGTENRRPQA